MCRSAVSLVKRNADDTTRFRYTGGFITFVGRTATFAIASFCFRLARMGVKTVK